jgi:hypothetical protein
MVDKLTPAQREALTHLPPTLEEWMKPLVKTIFDHTPDDETATLEKMFSRRFHISKVSAAPDSSDGKGQDWDAAGLRHSWPVLEALPPAQVEGNKSLTQFVRYKVAKKSQGEGYYDNPRVTSGIGAFGYDPKTLDQVDTTFSDKKDPMYGVNAWNETVRHEVGHAVDQAMHGSDKWCVGHAPGGNWKVYDTDFKKAADEMVKASGGAIDSSPQRAALVAAIAAAMDAQSYKVETAFAKLPAWSKLSAKEREEISADPVLQALGGNNTAAEPWMNDGGVVLGGRIFEESYDKSWNSYAAEARSRKTSKYQFRAPGEWFAEAYAAYYEPTVGGQQQGFKLEQVDPETKKWFDSFVDKKQPDRGKGNQAGS